MVTTFAWGIKAILQFKYTRLVFGLLSQFVSLLLSVFTLSLISHS